MTQIREPAVAGHFYPDHPGELSTTVQGMLRQGQARPGPAPKALIVPHAGYIYSGPVAATAYARLQPYRDLYHRVVLLGPCHRVATKGLAASTAGAFRTPLGDVPLDGEAIKQLGQRGVALSDAPHSLEHSLEVQLPFLQLVLGSFSLVPLAVGDTKPEAVAEVIDLLWDGPETLVVVSSDLSHYLSYEDAQRRDAATCRAIEGMDAHCIRSGDACGSTVVGGLLIAAKGRGMQIATLDLRNSGDTAGGKDQVVGYGSWILTEKIACE
jgi:AmmeMemoRadiSam system protein B